MLAEALWAMDSPTQVEFLKELALVVAEDNKTNKHAYSLGELQWFYVGAELELPGNELAKAMLMTMASPLYLHTLQFVETK